MTQAESYPSNDCEDIQVSKENKNVSIPWYIEEMGVSKVWHKNITGNGVVVSIVDDGVFRCHPTISENFDFKASFDFTDDDEDPSPINGDDWQV